MRSVHRLMTGAGTTEMKQGETAGVTFSVRSFVIVSNRPRRDMRDLEEMIEAHGGAIHPFVTTLTEELVVGRVDGDDDNACLARSHVRRGEISTDRWGRLEFLPEDDFRTELSESPRLPPHAAGRDSGWQWSHGEVAIPSARTESREAQSSCRPDWEGRIGPNWRSHSIETHHTQAHGDSPLATQGSRDIDDAGRLATARTSPVKLGTAHRPASSFALPGSPERSRGPPVGKLMASRSLAPSGKSVAR